MNVEQARETVLRALFDMRCAGDDVRVDALIAAVRAEERQSRQALVAALRKFVDSMKSDQREKCDVALAMARAVLAQEDK